MSGLDIAEAKSAVDLDNQHGSTAIGARIGKRSLRQRVHSINYALDKDDDNLRGVNRRSISRPQKLTSTVPTETDDLKLIQKFYVKKPLGRLKCTELETIYEDFSDEMKNGRGNKLKNSATGFGLRKLKRRLTFTTTKAVKERRKKRANLILGSVRRFKRISQQFFFDRLNALNAESKDDDDGVDMDQRTNAIATNAGQKID